MVDILIILNSVYCCAVLLVLVVLFKKISAKPLHVFPFISVVIAARNEEKRIQPTLQSLENIIYPKEKYEIIIVDDASRDNTAATIKKYIDNNSNWHLIRIFDKNDQLRGKKAALKKGISKAQGEIILTTDADCIVPKEWLPAMAAAFDSNTTMVLGHSLLLNQKTWLNKLLQFDNLFSGIMTAAPTLLGFPMTSVGRNMAYRKKAYLKSGGYDALSSYKSGDDVHLTELFRRKIEGKIVFNFNKNSFTYSKPPDSIKEIFNQQVRKNSKIFKKSLATIALSGFLFLYHILFILFPFLLQSSVNIWFVMLAIKLFIENVTLTVAARKFSDVSIIPFIIFMQLFYPLYVSILGLMGIFQKYEWKK